MDSARRTGEPRGTRPGRAIGALVLALGSGAALAGCGNSEAPGSPDRTPYPQVDESHLSSYQRTFLKTTRAEWSHPRRPQDYSGGADQEWCANYVSWTMRTAGNPLRNPNSGGWRIPGIYTLKDYYQSQGRFVPASRGYVPVTGDVAIYGPRSPFGAHTNMVIKTEGENVWTIGGNENGTITVSRHTRSELTGVLGYGRPARV